MGSRLGRLLARTSALSHSFIRKVSINCDLQKCALPADFSLRHSGRATVVFDHFCVLFFPSFVADWPALSFIIHTIQTTTAATASSTHKNTYRTHNMRNVKILTKIMRQFFHIALIILFSMFEIRPAK